MATKVLALTRFQEQRGLELTGQLDPDTAAAVDQHHQSLQALHLHGGPVPRQRENRSALGSEAACLGQGRRSGWDLKRS